MTIDDLVHTVTTDLVAAIEAGAGEWRMPWHQIPAVGLPVSVDGRPYRGLNALVLALAGFEHGYRSSTWATYRAWQRHGAQVRRGEHSTKVIVWKPPTVNVDTKATDDAGGDADRTRRGWWGRVFSVFAADQVDNPPAHTLAAPIELDSTERIAAADGYFAAVGADVVEGGNVACYDPTTDRIHLPRPAQFHTPALFYGTLAHEHIHWTAPAGRLDRTFAHRFETDAYAVEELTAELGAALWCGQTGLSVATRDDHVAYLAGWVRVLRQHPRVLLTVASKAQHALDYLNHAAGHTPPPAMHADPTDNAAVAA